MWKRLAKFVLQNRLVLLILLFLCTGLMAFYASKIKLSYEFSKAIPTDNPKYQDYLSFKNKFGDDGNLLVIGVQTDLFFELKNFESYRTLNNDLKKIPFVENVLSVVNAADLLKDTASQKLNAIPVFDSYAFYMENMETNIKGIIEKYLSNSTTDEFPRNKSWATAFRVLVLHIINLLFNQILQIN